MSVVSKLAKIHSERGKMTLGDITATKVGWMVKVGDLVIGYAENKEKAMEMMRKVSLEHSLPVHVQPTHNAIATIQ